MGVFDNIKIDKNGDVIGFSRTAGDEEWTGITMLRTKSTDDTDGHVYGMIEPKLPIRHLHVRMKEVDTPNDYKNAIRWVGGGYKDHE